MNPNIAKEGKRFSSTNQPANRGRKPKLYTSLIRSGYNISREEFIAVRRTLIQKTKEELDEIAKKYDTPIWVAIICRALIRSGSKGEVKVLDDIADSIFVKPKQEVDVSVHGGFMLTNKELKDEEEVKEFYKGLLESI